MSDFFFLKPLLGNYLSYNLGVLGCIVRVCPNSNRTFCMQTVETLIRRCVLRRLVWVFTVCQGARFIWVKRDKASFNRWRIDAQPDVNLRCAHMPFCWLCNAHNQLNSVVVALYFSTADFKDVIVYYSMFQ